MRLIRLILGGLILGEKEDRVSFWLQPRSYDKPDFREAWDRIGFGHQ